MVNEDKTHYIQVEFSGPFGGTFRECSNRMRLSEAAMTGGKLNKLKENGTMPHILKISVVPLKMDT